MRQGRQDGKGIDKQRTRDEYSESEPIQRWQQHTHTPDADADADATDTAVTGIIHCLLSIRLPVNGWSAVFAQSNNALSPFVSVSLSVSERVAGAVGEVVLDVFKARKLDSPVLANVSHSVKLVAGEEERSK